MSIQWQRDSSLVFESRDQAFSEVETLSNEHTYRVMQIDGHPPAYAIERKLPDRVQKYTDDESDSLLLDEDPAFEERAEKNSFKNDGMNRGRQAQRDQDERTDGVPSDEELYSGDYRDEWE
jgi:hypothetical protein